MKNEKWEMSSSLLYRLAFLSHLFHDRDEHVLQRVLLFAHLNDLDPLLLQLPGNTLTFGSCITVYNHMQTIAEQRHAPVIHLALEQVVSPLRCVSKELDYVPLLLGFQS